MKTRQWRNLTNVHLPLLVWCSITDKYNPVCKHCDSELTENAGSDELSTKESFELINDLSGRGQGLLIFGGGEPLCGDGFTGFSVEYIS